MTINSLKIELIILTYDEGGRKHMLALLNCFYEKVAISEFRLWMQTLNNLPKGPILYILYMIIIKPRGWLVVLSLIAFDLCIMQVLLHLHKPKGVMQHKHLNRDFLGQCFHLV